MKKYTDYLDIRIQNLMFNASTKEELNELKILMSLRQYLKFISLAFYVVLAFSIFATIF